jgi:hypothetical protein
VQGGRPITPLHAGHVGLLCTAGLLNGVFGQGIYRQLDEKATLDLANTLRGLALVNESAAKMDASKALWQEARELYAKCNVEAGVAECDEKFSQ